MKSVLLIIALFFAANAFSAPQMSSEKIQEAFTHSTSCKLIITGATAGSREAANELLAALRMFTVTSQTYAGALAGVDPKWGLLTYDEMVDAILVQIEMMPLAEIQEYGEACMAAYQMYKQTMMEKHQQPPLKLKELPEGQFI